jgi:glycosyltransferase involved in cell wall biosynthesis
MKVVQICASEGQLLGGMETQVLKLSERIAKQQPMAIHLVASEHLCAQTSTQIRAHTLNFSRSRRHPKLLWDLVLLLRQIKPDIIHCHGNKAGQMLALLSPCLPDIKLICTMHGTKNNYGFLKKFDRVIVVSKDIQNQLATFKPLLIENGVENKGTKQTGRQALYQQFNLDPHRPLLIAVGRLAKVKRYDLLMQASQHLPVNLLVMGDGPEREYLAQFETQHIKLAGFRNDVVDFYGAADALVITSQREGFSLSLIEALQAELPVLSTPVSGSASLLPKSCLLPTLSASEKPQLLHQALKQAITRLPKIKEDCGPAFAYAQHELTLEKAAEKLRACYDSTWSPT